MRALDLYCGLGGWSDGLVVEGFKVLGVELIPEIAELYKHPVIIADVRDLDGRNFQDYDLIVGSPPCRDFSRFAKQFGHNWVHNPPNPENGLTMIRAFLRIIDEAQPKYWLMENVPGLKEYFDLEPRCQVRLSKQRYRCFWGNFPAFLVPRDLSLKNMASNPNQKGVPNKGKYAKWENARIPIPVARSLGKVVREALKNARV